jgi:hypothetical protein
MVDPTSAQSSAWIGQRCAAGPALASVRAAELHAVNLCSVADELEEAFWARLKSEPVSTTSGLVEQQRLFTRGRP